MPNLIDKTYFTDIIRIDTTKQSIIDLLDEYITRYEPLLLENIAVTVGNEDEIKKMLTYFIYFYFTQDQMSLNTANGEVQIDSESGVKVLPTRKLVQAWNLGVDIYNEYATDRKEYINSFGI